DSARLAASHIATASAAPALHRAAAVGAPTVRRQRLYLLPQPAAPFHGSNTVRWRPRLGPRLDAGRLSLRHAPPAGHHAYRPRPAQRRRTPEKPRLASDAPVPAARHLRLEHHAFVPLYVRSEG